MPIVVPTVTAEDKNTFAQQIEKIRHFAVRLHIDLSDGIFAPRSLISPNLAWWPVGVKTDFHLMYRQPRKTIEELLPHNPNLIIIHAESEGDFEEIASLVKKHNVKAGVALLPETPADAIIPALESIDHVLIFSGNLGYQGGSTADIKHLNKAKFLKSLKPDLEIGWDGGINNQNISELIFGGIGVLNVGGFIQAAENPAEEFNKLQRIADETGTT